MNLTRREMLGALAAPRQGHGEPDPQTEFHLHPN